MLFLPLTFLGQKSLYTTLPYFQTKAILELKSPLVFLSGFRAHSSDLLHHANIADS